MLSVISILTTINIAAAILIGIFLLRKNYWHNMKIAHFSILSLSACELLYFALLATNSGDWNAYGLFASIFLQITWSCVLLYNSLQLQALKKEKHTLEEELAKHQHLYAEIKSLALSDGLTNIANRRNFDMLLKTELHRATALNKPMSLIILDLDRFKTYNDTFGHLTGDKLLTQIGQLLLHHVRPIDLPARYGGEEFSIILPDLDLKGATSIAEKLRRLIETSSFPDHSDTFTAKITASFGVATYDPAILLTPPDAEKIISIADKSLYKAKQQGRNCVIAASIFQ